jgi:molybdate transport system regulatory protein
MPLFLEGHNGFARWAASVHMDLDVGVDPTLAKAEVRFSRRDVELLRAIHEQGSLNKGAEALGRSYSRSQQRIVELEETFGQLVDRQRGGSGGGGSSLTETARELLTEFDRVHSECTGVADVDRSILDGTVVEQDGELGAVETTAGTVRAVIPPNTKDVRVAIRADAITLHTPETVPEAKTSARNHFRGEVRNVRLGDAIARVLLTIGPDTDLCALVTQTSVDTLNLTPGETIAASFKATATRAFPADSFRNPADSL